MVITEWIEIERCLQQIDENDALQPVYLINWCEVVPEVKGGPGRTIVSSYPTYERALHYARDWDLPIIDLIPASYKSRRRDEKQAA
jgi:hypothetical protein